MTQPPTQESTLKPSSHDNNPSETSPIPPSINDLYPNLDQIKQKKRYRNSISTESPIVVLTPPKQDEIVREERRLSNASAHSIASTGSAKESEEPKSPKHENHLLPPAEPEPEEIVARLISQRRPSTITTLSNIIKQIFIEKKIKEDGIPSEIISGLYLGSIGAAKNLEWLKHHGVTHVLCVAGGIGECYPKQFIYKVVDINDDANEDISAFFKSCYQFIENCLNNNGKCLVHCFAGMSRSVTVVSAYLMCKKRMYAVPALKFVKTKRTIANPNAGFIVQLIKYQTKLGMRRKNSLDLPTSDYDISDDSDTEEAKSDKPKNKSFKSLAFAIKNKGGLNDMSKKHNEKNDKSSTKLKIKLSPMVKEMDTGRRPSLFTALAKLRGLKNRARASSTDSTHSNISNMSENVNTKESVLRIQTPDKCDDNKDCELPPPNVNTGLTPVSQAKLMLLKEVSNETDASSPDKNNNFLKLQHIKVDHNIVDEDDVITPLETCDNNQTFPDIKSNNKSVDL